MSAPSATSLAILHHRVADLYERRDLEATLAAVAITDALNAHGLTDEQARELLANAHRVLDLVQPLVTCQTEQPEHDGPMGVHRRRHSCSDVQGALPEELAQWEHVNL